MERRRYITNEKEESKLINIEANDGRWILYETSDVKIVTNNGISNKVSVDVNSFYVLKRNNINYLIYVSNLKFNSIKAYSYNTDINLIIGNINDATIKYDLQYLNNQLVKISVQNGKLTLERTTSLPAYINKFALQNTNYILTNGDLVEVYGISLLFLNNILLINQVATIDLGRAKITNYPFPLLDNPINVEVKDIDLYNKDDYFSKSPRLRRIIETKTIKLSAPPRENDSNQLPLILVIGPMLTMGIMATTMLVNNISRIYSHQTTVAESWPQLVMSGTMLISMLVWPLVTQWYNRRMKKKHKEELIKKFNKKVSYINPKTTNWNHEIEMKMRKEKQKCKYILYVITSEMKGVLAIANLVDLANKSPERLLFCYIKEGFDEKLINSLEEVKFLLKEHNVKTFENFVSTLCGISRRQKE